MKQIYFSLLFLASNSASMMAQDVAGSNISASDSIPTNSVISPRVYTVIARGPNSRTWAAVTLQTNILGTTTSATNCYTELETGMHRMNSQGKWILSTDEVVPVPGGALATNTAHQVFFAANPNVPEALRLTMPDGRELRSHVLCLSYFDRSTGSNAIIAELQDSTGQIVAANKVLYTNALSGDCVADILYRNTKAGIEQNIVLRSQPPSPAEYGISNAMLQVWTEFVNPPAPSICSPVDGSVDQDNQLDFGAMKIGPGKAFLIGGQTDQFIRVQKRWVSIQGRTFLVEEVPVNPITTQLQALPPSSSASGNGVAPGKQGSLSPLLLKTHFAQVATNAMQVAKSDRLHEPGYLIDYDLTSATNFTFQADTTYYVSGGVFLSGSNVFEGGCVIKYATNAQIEVWPFGTTNTLTFLSTAYRPVIFTAKDDQSVGETISGSASSPSGYYANWVLVLSGGAQAPSIAHVRVSYAANGILISGSSADISDAQFVNCEFTFYLINSTIRMRNVLMANCLTNFDFDAGVTLSAENTTFSGCNYLAVGPPSPSGCAMALTNCILADITNLTTGVIDLSGGTNGFYISPTFGTVVTNSAYPFQSVGGASYYLTNGCSFLNAGTTNINSTLLASLRQKTTWPPLVFSNATISADTNFGPSAARDTGSRPSLGYHYEPLDYAFGGSDANANVTFTAGTAVGWFRTSSGYNNHVGHGIHVGDTKTLTFDGTATSPDYWVRCSVVQEGGTGNWDGGYGPGGITGWTWPDINQAPWLKAHFTRFSVPASDSMHFRDDNGYLLVNAYSCEFYGGGVGGYVDAVQFTNCLLDRVFWWLEGGRPETWLTMENCTMHGGMLYINRWDDGVNGQTPVTIHDSAFDSTTFTTQDAYADDTNLTHCDYNAFQQSAQRLYPQGSHDVLVTNFNWQISWLGNFYLPTNSPLINTGMVTADLMGLFHYTTQTNQIKETNSVVDIGFHYVATNNTGFPVDTDGDRVPDYLEDLNGNGNGADDPTSWLIYNSPNGLIGPAALQVFTPLK